MRTINFGIRLERRVLDELRECAEADRRSVNAMINLALEGWLAAHRGGRERLEERAA